jgi:hypothetical protein
VDLEVLSVMVDTFIMNVDLGGQIGILNKESEKNSVLYEECIAESNRLKKVFSSSLSDLGGRIIFGKV